MTKVIIFGAGISCLTVAHELIDKGYEVNQKQQSVAQNKFYFSLNNFVFLKIVKKFKN